MNLFKSIVNNLLNTDSESVKSATIEMTVNRDFFINALSEWNSYYDINEVFCNSNDWELTFTNVEDSNSTNVALHSWMMYGDEIKVLILSGKDANHYYDKYVRCNLNDSEMFKFHINELHKLA